MEMVTKELCLPYFLVVEKVFETLKNMATGVVIHNIMTIIAIKS
jgi:hypothetical protein